METINYSIAFCVLLFLVKNGALVIGQLSGEMLDLSWPYGNDTIFWPGVRRFEYTKKHAGPGTHGGW